jgi:hypothetical protein
MTLQRFQCALAAICIFINEPEISQLRVLVSLFKGRTSQKSPQISSPKMGMVYAILVGLFYHDRLIEIPIVLAKYPVSSLTLSYAVSLVCKDSEPSDRLIPQLQSLLNSHPDQIQQLEIAQTLVTQGQSQTIAQEQLGRNSIAYSLYVFLSTPTAWEICIQRAGKLQIPVGAIAAIYQAEMPNFPQSSTQIYRAREIGRELGQQLFSYWAGIVLEPGNPISDSILISAP